MSAVPSGVESCKQNLDLTLTIDGEPRTTTLRGDNGVIITQKAKSGITIALSDSGISVQTASVGNWNVVEVSGHKVTNEITEDVTGQIHPQTAKSVIFVSHKIRDGYLAKEM